MNIDKNKQWVFFWAAPDPNYEISLDEEREFQRKMFMRHALLANLLAENIDETPPQAS